MSGPALTPEQWAERAIYVATREGGKEPQRLLYSVEDKDGVLLFKTGCGGASAVGFTRHAIAALALAGAPFGFTWTDVDTLEEVISAASWIEDRCTSFAEIQEVRADAERARNTVARIAALLPPREG